MNRGSTAYQPVVKRVYRVPAKHYVLFCSEASSTGRPGVLYGQEQDVASLQTHTTEG